MSESPPPTKIEKVAEFTDDLGIRDLEQNSCEPYFGNQLSLKESFKALWTSRRAAMAMFACSSSAILIGYDLTLIGSIIANKEFVLKFGEYHESLDSYILPANHQLVWTVVQFVAAVFGAFSVGQLNDIFGRRICFYATVLLTLCGTISELFAPNWRVWTVAKLFFGTAMGFMQGNTQTYVSELAPVHVRGFMLSLFQVWIILGSFLASCVLEGTSHIDGPWSWKAAIVSQLGLGAFCLAVFFPLVPESPYYLYAKGRTDAAASSLLTLRGKEASYAPDNDIRVIEDSIAQDRLLCAEAASYLDCFKGTDRRRTLLACLPMIMQHFCGYPLCGNYLAYFLTLSGVSDSFLITVISIMFAMFAVITAFALVEHVGRRPQLLGGTFGMLPCLLGIGILGFVHSGTPANGKGLAAVAIIWNIFYYLSVGAIGWAIVGEISSSRLRAKTTSIAAAANSVVNMAFSIGIPYLINAEEANLGPKAGFVFFGPSVILAAVAFFVIPETKNKSFAELDALFKSKTPARRFN